jgi:hypothetical protein
LAAGQGLVDLVHILTDQTGSGTTALYCTVPRRAEAIEAARAHFGLPLEVCDGQCGAANPEPQLAATRNEDPPPEEEEEPEDPPPPDEDGSGSSGAGATPDWDPYFNYDEDEQLRQACDSGDGQAYEGEWYTCTITRDEQREAQMESLIRGNVDAHPYCETVADEWGAKRNAGMVGWWSETVPRTGGIALGHYHDVQSGLEPVGHIHVFEGNDDHPRTWSDLLRSTVHETLHALEWRHDDIVVDGLTFREINAICAAGEDRG